MSKKIYEITKKIHEELERLGVEIKNYYNLDLYWIKEYKDPSRYMKKKMIERGEDLFLYCLVNKDEYNSAEYPYYYEEKESQKAILEPQIRQILVAVANKLGKDKKHLKKVEYIKDMMLYDDACNRSFDYLMKNTYPTQAEALCHRWLDGLNPLFSKDPEKVLKELLETLKNL